MQDNNYLPRNFATLPYSEIIRSFTIAYDDIEKNTIFILIALDNNQTIYIFDRICIVLCF